MKTNKPAKYSSLLVAIAFAVLLASVGQASASPVVTPVLSANSASYSISSNLLTGLIGTAVGSPTNAGGPNPFPSGSLASLTNDTVTNNDSTGIAAGVSENAVTELTYSLGAAYNITSATTYTGWSDDGRYAQNLTLSFSTDGATFTPYASTNSGGVGGANEDTVTFTDTTGTLFSGAKYARFDFGSVPNWSDFTQLSIAGTLATTPEPSAALLLLGGVGALVLVSKLRRRSSV